MQEPRARVICCETDSHIVPSDTSGYDITANLWEKRKFSQSIRALWYDTYRIVVVINSASRASDNIESMLQRKGSIRAAIEIEEPNIHHVNGTDAM
jgi:hypothetical protein